MQIQTIKYGLNDTKRIKKKQVTLILYTFTIYDLKSDTELKSRSLKLFHQNTFR